MKDAIFGILRHVLTAGGGFLVAQGYIDASNVPELVGAVMTIAGIAWSVYDKQGRA